MSKSSEKCGWKSHLVSDYRRSGNKSKEFWLCLVENRHYKVLVAATENEYCFRTFETGRLTIMFKFIFTKMWETQKKRKYKWNLKTFFSLDSLTKYFQMNQTDRNLSPLAISTKGDFSTANEVEDQVQGQFWGNWIDEPLSFTLGKGTAWGNNQHGH